MKNMKTIYNLNEASKCYNDERYIYRHEALVKSKYVVQKLADKIKEKDVLDLGLGHGFVHENLSKEAKSYTIIEGSEKLIAEYKVGESAGRKDFNIICSYFEDYIPAKKYDVIIIGGVLTIVENPLEVLRQYKEYLKEHGKMIIIEMNAMSLHKRIGFEAGIVESVYDLADYQKNSGIRRLYTMDSIKELVEQAGLKIHDVDGILLKPITGKQMKTLDFSDDIFNALLKIGSLYPELCNHLYLECYNNACSQQ